MVLDLVPRVLVMRKQVFGIQFDTGGELIDGRSLGTKVEVLLNMTVETNDGDALGVIGGKSDGVRLKTNNSS